MNPLEDVIGQRSVPKHVYGPLEAFHQDNYVKNNKGCLCKQSRCLKLYCMCFSEGKYCNPNYCHCSNCQNTNEYENIRLNAIKQSVRANPEVFRSKLNRCTGISDRSKIEECCCSCRRSKCLLKYCECFQAGVLCTSRCNCVDCKNNERNQFIQNRKLCSNEIESNQNTKENTIKQERSGFGLSSPTRNTKSKYSDSSFTFSSRKDINTTSTETQNNDDFSLSLVSIHQLATQLMHLAYETLNQNGTSISLQSLERQYYEQASSSVKRILATTQSDELMNNRVSDSPSYQSISNTTVSTDPHQDIPTKSLSLTLPVKHNKDESINTPKHNQSLISSSISPSTVNKNTVFDTKFHTMKNDSLRQMTESELIPLLSLTGSPQRKSTPQWKTSKKYSSKIINNNQIQSIEQETQLREDKTKVKSPLIQKEVSNSSIRNSNQLLHNESKTVRDSITTNSKRLKLNHDTLNEIPIVSLMQSNPDVSSSPILQESTQQIQNQIGENPSTLSSSTLTTAIFECSDEEI